MNLLVLGHGYSAERFVARAGHRFDRIAVTTRSAQRAAELAGQGLDAHVFDGGQAFDGGDAGMALLAAAAAATHIVNSVPPAANGDPALLALGERLSASGRLRWLACLSTVGVYGDHGGGWVDEETPCNPGQARSQARIDAERGWQALAGKAGATAHVLRLSGIYGPGRSAIDQIRAGSARRIVKPGQVFNRIHADDIAGALERLLDVPEGGIWNVTDDEPAPPQDVVAYAARLLGLEPPPEIPFEKAVLSPMAASFYAENKRVSNRKLRDVAGYALQFPTYREGLAAIAAAG